MSTIQSQARTLETDCQRTVGDLRSALIDLYASLSIDPTVPQDVSRQFGLNKNLTWKISKIIHASDGFSAIQHLPGASGWEIFLGAMSSAGAPLDIIERVRGACKSFDDFVTLHAGDRSNLELILDSMGVGGAGLQLENSRLLSFQGNSGIWGVQAKVRLTAGFVVPDSKDSSRVVTAVLGGLGGFRRLRPNVPWPLFRFSSYSDTGELVEANMELLGENSKGKPDRLMRRFSSPNLPEFQIDQLGSATEYILPPGPVGNLGSFSCYLGNMVFGAQRYRSEKDRHAEFASSITLPTETMIFDVYVHRELPMPDMPQAMVYGRPMGGPDDPSSRREEYRLPLSERCQPLAGSPPSVASPLLPRYGEVVKHVAERMGCTMNELSGYRLQVAYPPMASTLLIRWALPEQPR